MPDTLGPYRILRKIGEGGMGSVFVAHDPRLERDVALKVIRKETADPGASDRMLREARAAARVNHPNVCQIFEVGVHDGEPYLVMELLEGEPLSRRLERGPMPPAEALATAQQVLAALAALHAKGVVHRDLKPANVFLSVHGVKVLDFGLARPGPAGEKTELALTRSGAVVGTPRYIAPEQWEGRPASPASDLFALGAVLFEMLAGRPAFPGETIAEVCRAILAGRLPALTGGPVVAAADRLLARALRTRPEDRWPSADAMGAAVRDALAVPDAVTARLARPATAVTRLAALPFRMLRPDPETDFLATGLPDEVSNALSGLGSVVVRSSAAAARAAGDPPDLRALAAELDVDAVLTGTLLRAGDGLRVATQLVELPAGTIVWSRSATLKLGDLFALLEDLARQIVEGLKVRLSPKEEKALNRDVPASPAAYEKYLRANRLNLSLADTTLIREARSLYEACVGEDPSYAPAWARLGRVYRILGKYSLGEAPEEMIRRAEEAFRKAFALNPDLRLAHQYFTNFEVEVLGRTQEAMERLLGLARDGSADPHAFAGLAYVLRFAGLCEESLAADERARRLEPGLRTSAQYTLYYLGRYAEAIERDQDDPTTIRWTSMMAGGRAPEAALEMRARLDRGMEGRERQHVLSILAVAEGRLEDARQEFRRFIDSGFRDPEGLFFYGALALKVGAEELGADLLKRAVDGGFFCVPAFEGEFGSDELRNRPAVLAARELATRRRDRAREAFDRLGGARLLGLSPS